MPEHSLQFLRTAPHHLVYMVIKLHSTTFAANGARCMTWLVSLEVYIHSFERHLLRYMSAPQLCSNYDVGKVVN